MVNFDPFNPFGHNPLTQVIRCDMLMTSSDNDHKQPMPDLQALVTEGVHKMTKCFNFLEGKLDYFFGDTDIHSIV